MPHQPLRILLIDDDEDDYILTSELLRKIGGERFEIRWIQRYDDALEALVSGGHDACLVDFRLDTRNGIELIARAREQGVDTPIILLTGQGGHDVDLAAMNAGAADFLEKSSLTADALERSLRYSIHSHRVEHQRARLLAVAEQQAAQLRHLASELTQAEQRERRRVAQTLHDHLQQLLVAAKMRVDRLQSLATDPKLKKTAEQIDALLADSIEASRNLTVQLSPPVLHDRGLVPALEWLSRQFAKEHDLAVEVIGIDDANDVDDHVRDFLFQAVRELLFNVVKHAGAREAQVVVRTEAGMVQVTVRDEGVGCDPATLLDRPSEEGFGLFHVQRRVEFLGGRFEVDAAPGTGCVVSITVPMGSSPRSAASRPLLPVTPAPASAAASQPPLPPPRPARPGATRVLLVDDHKILREGIAGLLRDEGDIELVGQAADGIAAVELVDRLRPDVVVMDVTMPRMNGVDATQIIKKRHPHTRVVGLSMHEASDMADAMRNAGADDYLPKGGPAEDLVAAIRRHQAAHAPSA